MQTRGSFDAQITSPQLGRKPGIAREVIGIALLLLVGLHSVVASELWPRRRRCRCGHPETRAIGALKTIGTAQSLFREADKEADGNLDYGTLAELANSGTTGLVDKVLGSGTKNGYLFEVTYSRTTSEFLWFATARPMNPWNGDRYFAANHEGVTFYTISQPFALNGIDCTIPAGVQPVGR